MQRRIPVSSGLTKRPTSKTSPSRPTRASTPPRRWTTRLPPQTLPTPRSDARLAPYASSVDAAEAGPTRIEVERLATHEAGQPHPGLDRQVDGEGRGGG